MMTLHSEIERLRHDYPHLTAEFKGRHGDWSCHLMQETRMFGLYGIKSGHGKTKKAALRDARSGFDANVAAAAHCETEAKRLSEQTAQREKSLDDAVFSAI